LKEQPPVEEEKNNNSNNLTTSTTNFLTPVQETLLLEIFVTTACHVFEAIKKSNNVNNELENNNNTNANKNKEKFDIINFYDVKFLQHTYEALTSILLQNLTFLLKKYKDNEVNLNLVLNLLNYCDFSSNKSNLRSLKSLYKIVNTIFTSNSNEQILLKIVIVIKKWLLISGSTQEFIRNSLCELVNEIFLKIVDAMNNLNRIASIINIDGDNIIDNNNVDNNINNDDDDNVVMTKRKKNKKISNDRNNDIQVAFFFLLYIIIIIIIKKKIIYKVISI
jgi:hypothetical protein